MGLNTRGVVGREIVGKSNDWSLLSTLLVFECHRRFDECTIKLGYAPLLTAITFRRVGSA